MISLFCKGYIGVLMILALLLAATSCEKESVYDELEQHWRLEQFTLLAKSEVVCCNRIFFGITHMVTEMAEKQVSDGYQDGEPLKGYGAYIARTEYRNEGKVLVLRNFKVRAFTGDTKQDATVEQLLPFGINNPEVSAFKVIELSKGRLVLESEYARLELKKF